MHSLGQAACSLSLCVNNKISIDKLLFLMTFYDFFPWDCCSCKRLGTKLTETCFSDSGWISMSSRKKTKSCFWSQKNILFQFLTFLEKKLIFFFIDEILQKKSTVAPNVSLPMTLGQKATRLMPSSKKSIGKKSDRTYTWYGFDPSHVQMILSPLGHEEVG